MHARHHTRRYGDRMSYVRGTAEIVFALLLTMAAEWARDHVWTDWTGAEFSGQKEWDYVWSQPAVEGRGGVAGFDQGHGGWRLADFRQLYVERVAATGGGAIVNVLSEAARVCVPFAGSYCASKSAAWIMTQGVRAELAAQGTHVMAAFPASTDTPMVSMLDMDDLLDPVYVAGTLIDALEGGLDDISIGEHAIYMEKLMYSDYKALERESAAILPGATAVADVEN